MVLNYPSFQTLAMVNCPSVIFGIEMVLKIAFPSAIKISAPGMSALIFGTHLSYYPLLLVSLYLG
jgi:hypothetical protein